jgi:hypothetical protein
MLAVKANYNKGQITFINPIPDNIKVARLTIVIEPEENENNYVIPTNEFSENVKESETEFKLIGLHSFFDTEDDKNINWEEYFGLNK